MGARARGARRGRDPHYFGRARWHHAGLRPRARRLGGARGQDTGDRLGRRGQLRAYASGHPGGGRLGGRRREHVPFHRADACGSEGCAPGRRHSRAQELPRVMKVAFRTDASREIGSGHVMRCLALAAELRSRGAEITFVCRALPEHYASLIAQAGHSLVEHDAVAADWLVVDHYGLDARWEREQRAHARKILAVDDLADRPHDCDVLVDQNLARNAQERYAGRVPAGCELLLGPRFALLRPEFAQIREGWHEPREARGAPRVIIMFGGADPEDLTSRCVEVLAKIGFAGPLDVVAGPLYRPSAAMRSVTLHRAPSNMAELMAR